MERWLENFQGYSTGEPGRIPLLYKWEPKEDITVYELALAAPAFASRTATDLSRFVDGLPANVRRHFQEY